jgi:TPR repeat protein
MTFFIRVIYNAQGYTFVYLPLHVPRPIAGAPMYDMSLTCRERLRAVGSGLKCKLVRLLSLGVGRHFEPQSNRRACNQIMRITARRVAAGLFEALRKKVAKEAEEMCASGQCAAAVVPLLRAVDLGHLPSRALKAWMLIRGREGVAKDCDAAFELVKEGASLGCHHCQGVMASCYRFGYGCVRNAAQSLELARESSVKGSRYGQYVLGELYEFGVGGVAQDYAQALALYRLAAAQNLDGAQLSLGYMYYGGYGVAQDYAEALRWYQLAAAQGLPSALFDVAFCHEFGLGVHKNKAEAIRWYRRAQAAGYTGGRYALLKLGALE